MEIAVTLLEKIKNSLLEPITKCKLKGHYLWHSKKKGKKKKNSLDVTFKNISKIKKSKCTKRMRNGQSLCAIALKIVHIYISALMYFCTKLFLQMIKI